MNKEDKKYLIKILEEHHQKENQLTINKCSHDNCWYKKLKKELKRSLEEAGK